MAFIAILDPFAGISGDMTLGALLDAGVDPEWLRELPKRFGLEDVSVNISRTTRCAVTATKVDFEIPRSMSDSTHEIHHGHTVAGIIEKLESASLIETVRSKAIAAFQLLGDAEGRAHGVKPEAVHLHEVGAIDAILDIVGAIEGFERLGVDAVYNLPVAVGNGWAKMAHGTMPVPAAATATLLEGIAVRTDGPIEGEATTPTGATLLRVLSKGAPPVYWRMQKNSWGAGTRDTKNYPNALRLLLAETADEAGMVEIIQTDIDDFQPEYIDPLRAALLANGALDCSIWPTHGKKGRISIRIEVLAPPDRAESVTEALIANSSTAGIRRWSAVRKTLARQQFQVELEGADGVRIKVWDGPGGYRLKPEYDDVIRAAAQLGMPPIDVAREVERRAEDLLAESKIAKKFERRD